MEKVFIKLNSNTTKNILLSSKDISWAVIGLFGFFIGRISIFNAINPIAIAYLGNFLNFGLTFYSIVAFLFLSFAFSFEGVFLLKYIACLTLLSAINFYLEKNNAKLNTYIKASLSSCAILVSSILVAAIGGLSFFYYILSIVEASLVFTLVILLEKSTKLLVTKRRSKNVSTEEIISISILAGAIIAGSSDITVSIFSITVIYSSLLLLIIGYKGGSSLGAIFGTIIGIFLYLVGFSGISTPVILSIVGISIGFFKEKSKVYFILAFIVSGFTSILFIDSSLFTMSIIWSSLLSAMFFYVMPQNFYLNFHSITNPNLYNNENYLIHMREITNYRLMSISKSFEKLSKTFTNLSKKSTCLEYGDISNLVDEIASKVCYDCKLSTTCWKVNFHDTYKSVFKVLNGLENKGTLSLDNLPQNFVNSCIKLEEFVDITNMHFALYKSNLAWQNAIVESRELVSQQLLGISDIIQNLATELNVELKFNQELEDNIILEFKKNKIEVKKVIVLENKAGKYEVSVTGANCFGQQNTSVYTTVISRVIGRKMKRENKYCEHISNKCVLHLVEEQKFRVSSGVSRVTKDNSSQSGDSYSFMELKQGQCLLALSDGMGSGQKARAESAATVDLLEDFIDSGFDKDIAIKIINSVLVLKNTDDTFSTLDICSIDLYSGNAEFVKIGAASTFILRDGVVSVIKSSSLPMGVINNLEIEVCSKILKDKDIIVMVTDGLTELIAPETDVSWLIETIESFKGTNPQDLSDKIILEAKNTSNNIIKDDITVLVSRIWKK
jgi:stage II sporulation protein E